MKRKMLFASLFVAHVVLAQDTGVYNRALYNFNIADYEAATRQFYEVSETATDVELRQKSEYYLAASLSKKGLPVTAFVYYAAILKAGKKHPFYLKAVEGLVNVQETVGDQYLIPNLLDKNYNAEEWTALPVEALARINYFIGSISHRKAKFNDAKSFLEAVPKESAMYAKAQYLLATVLADSRFPKGARTEEAIRIYEGILTITDLHQKDLVATKQLALLGLGRVNYNIGEYRKSVEAYEQIPRFSRFWDQSLFENGFARFQNDDFGGALGSLQALHAPQFTGAFQPESWILKSTAYYFSCLYPEAKAALRSFDEIYLPMQEKLKLAIDQGKSQELSYYFNLIDSDQSTALPRAVVNFARTNERMLGMSRMLKQIDQEKAQIGLLASWKQGKLSDELISYLNQNREILVQVAGQLAKNRLQEAYGNIKEFTDQAEIIRFETSKAEKEIAEAGVNQRAMLKAQPLYRPVMPAEDWNYWKFEGEFWRDEIGYYQYTLKKGCPAAGKE